MPIRAHSQEDGGGAPSPSTSKGQKGKESEYFCFSLPPDARPGEVPKGALPSLGGAMQYFYKTFWLEVCGKKRCMETKACFGLHWGRWRITLMQLPNSGPGDTPKGVSLGLVRGVHYFLRDVFRWQHTEKAMHGYPSVFWAPLGATLCRHHTIAERWARQCGERRVALPQGRRAVLFTEIFWLVVCGKSDAWKPKHVLGCIGGAGIPPSHSCQTLSRAMH